MKPIGSRTIQTRRLILRAPQMKDAEALVHIRSLAIPLHESRKAMAKIVDELERPFTYHWVITRENRVIGRVKAWDVSPYNGYLQLGYDIAPDCRGQGYMTEALRGVLRYMFLEAKVNRVFCSVRSGNMASRRVCEKAGMQQEGILRQHYARQDGGFDDVFIYGMVRSELGEKE